MPRKEAAQYASSTSDPAHRSAQTEHGLLASLQPINVRVNYVRLSDVVNQVTEASAGSAGAESLAGARRSALAADHHNSLQYL
jgi:hypothetical protein